MSVCDADTAVPGTTMSLRDSARRYFEAARLLLRRPERTILVVAHAPVLRWIVQAAQGRTDPLDYDHPVFAHADAVEVDVATLGGYDWMHLNLTRLWCCLADRGAEG
jgi:broad specificity phosphatase PhoE